MTAARSLGVLDERRASMNVVKRGASSAKTRTLPVGDLLGHVARHALHHLGEVIVGQVLPGPPGDAVVEALQHRLHGIVVGQELLRPSREDFTPDGGPGRLGRPDGEGAPRGVLPGAGVAQLHGELVVALRDPQVPLYGVRHGRNVLNRHVHRLHRRAQPRVSLVERCYLGGGGTLTRRPGASNCPTGPCITFSNWSRRWVTEMPSQYRPP